MVESTAYDAEQQSQNLDPILGRIRAELNGGDGTAATPGQEPSIAELLEHIRQQLEGQGAKPETYELSQIQSEIEAAMVGHRQTGQINPRMPGVHNAGAQFLKKLIRRSLTWYTRPIHLFQGGVVRALRHAHFVLQTHDSELLAQADAMQRIIEQNKRLAERVTAMNSELREQHDKLAARMRKLYASVLGDRQLALGTLEPEPWEMDFPSVVNEADILSCFRLLLGRLPHQWEWPAHVCRVGEDLAPVVSSYLNSHEFTNRKLLRRSANNCELVELPHLKMYVPLDDALVGKVIAQTHGYEPHVTRIFQEYLVPGMRVLDIGANVGYFSMLAASLVGPSGIVYSWEPSPINVKMLLASQLANDFNNIKIVQAAATDVTGLLKYFTNSSNGNVATHINDGPEDILSADIVMGLRVDDFIPEDVNIGLVKIDVEGFEFKALQGAWKTIERSRPIIVSEFSVNGLKYGSGVSGREYLELFARLDYDILVITESDLVPEDIEQILSRFQQAGSDHIDILLRPRGGS